MPPEAAVRRGFRSCCPSGPRRWPQPGQHSRWTAQPSTWLPRTPPGFLCSPSPSPSLQFPQVMSDSGPSPLSTDSHAQLTRLSSLLDKCIWPFLEFIHLNINILSPNRMNIANYTDWACGIFWCTISVFWNLGLLISKKCVRYYLFKILLVFSDSQDWVISKWIHYPVWNKKTIKINNNFQVTGH